MRSHATRQFAALAAVTLIFALLPFVTGPDALPQATRILVFAGAAMSLNLLVGATGLISLGHGLFFGWGAYVVAIGISRYGLSYAQTAAIALASAVPLAAVVAIISLRARHLFFGLLTMAIGQVAFVLVSSNYQFTGGDDGLVGIPMPAWLDPNDAKFYLALGVFFIVCLVLLRLSSSPFGFLLGAVRDNPDRVASLGGNPKRVELAAMIIAGVLGCVFGVVWTAAEGGVEPGLFSWVTSALLLIMVALGGRTFFLGPLLGAVILETTRSYVQLRSSNADLVVGVVVILCVVLFPEGVGPTLRQRFLRKPAGRDAAAGAITRKAS